MATWEQGAGVVELPDGRRVRGRGLRAGLGDRAAPDLGVYLVGADPGPLPWEHRWVRCGDFRAPRDPDAAFTALREAYDRADAERVEVGCGGGVGRTGLALCVLAVVGGIAPDDAVAWVRERHHPRAVETPWQRRWVHRLPAPALRA
ncbi:hypothetical protein KSP35_06790 [Aquihabitans sp. G128]|uniref:hypothetical protein n=1 Tax=Aquihabitans sp. G128 TaxID=2849779 RepID=UPI001C244526|nr:hypothetical protein [Aquihabitans sp. G128]QXC62502.1 hypothetical protein KSP35_06790 [Aquihabitans sp. G128]